MALRIRDRGFLTQRILTVKPRGVVCSEAAAFTDRKEFAFEDIECVLLSAANRLSVQAGGKVFSLRVRPDKQAHQEVIRALLEAVCQARGIAVGSPA